MDRRPPHPKFARFANIGLKQSLKIFQIFTIMIKNLTRLLLSRGPTSCPSPTS